MISNVKKVNEQVTYVLLQVSPIFKEQFYVDHQCRTRIPRSRSCIALRLRLQQNNTAPCGSTTLGVIDPTDKKICA
jgi:hypothetical protein